MAQFRNPAFQGVSDVLSQIQQTRLQAPMLEGRLRGLVAQARQRNAAASLDEQTRGARGSARDRLLGAADVLAGGEGGGEGGVDPNALLLGTAGDLVGGGDTGDFGAVLSGITSIPGVGGQFDPRERDNVFVGTGTQNAKDTFTGLADVLASNERVANIPASSRGGSSKGGSSKGLSSGGRSFLDRKVRNTLKDADAGEFEGAANIAADAVVLAERLMAERGISENEAIQQVLQALEITQPETVDPPGLFNKHEAPGSVALGDLFVVDPGADDPVGGDAAAPESTDPAPPTEAPAPPSGAVGSGPLPVAIESEAIRAIRRGADPAAVLQRLRDMGYDPRTSTALGQMVR